MSLRIDGSTSESSRADGASAPPVKGAAGSGTREAFGAALETALGGAEKTSSRSRGAATDHTTAKTERKADAGKPRPSSARERPKSKARGGAQGGTHAEDVVEPRAVLAESPRGEGSLVLVAPTGSRSGPPSEAVDGAATFEGGSSPARPIARGASPRIESLSGTSDAGPMALPPALAGELERAFFAGASAGEGDGTSATSTLGSSTLHASGASALAAVSPNAGTPLRADAAGALASSPTPTPRELGEAPGTEARPAGARAVSAGGATMNASDADARASRPTAPASVDVRLPTAPASVDVRLPTPPTPLAPEAPLVPRGSSPRSASASSALEEQPALARGGRDAVTKSAKRTTPDAVQGAHPATTGVGADGAQVPAVVDGSAGRLDVQDVGATSTSSGADAAPADARERRLEATHQAVNRMALRQSVHAEVELPELGRIAIGVHGHAGSLDVRLRASHDDTARELAARASELTGDIRGAHIPVARVVVESSAAGAPTSYESQNSGQRHGADAGSSDGSHRTPERDEAERSTRVEIAKTPASQAPRRPVRIVL